MVEEQLSFVFTLQEELLERLDAALVGKGDPSLLGLIGTYVALEPFDDAFAAEYVSNALRRADWEHSVEEFCEPGLRRLVMGLTGGNPRLFANYLEQVTDLAAEKRVHPISPELLCEVLKDPFERQEGMKKQHWNALAAVARSEKGLPAGGAHESACKALVRKKLLMKPRCSKRYVFRRST